MLSTSVTIRKRLRISSRSSPVRFYAANFPSDFSSLAGSRNIFGKNSWLLRHLLQRTVWLYRTSTQTSIFGHSIDHVSPLYTKRIIDLCEISHFRGLRSQISTNLLRDQPD